jgi:branched-chain amino acid transport system ATP-binding protein
MVENLLETLEAVRASGLTVLLVEQNIPFGLRVAGTACLMQRGRIVHQGAVEDLDEERLATHLGVGRLLRGSISHPKKKPLKVATVSGGPSG